LLARRLGLLAARKAAACRTVRRGQKEKSPRRLAGRWHEGRSRSGRPEGDRGRWWSDRATASIWRQADKPQPTPLSWDIYRAASKAKWIGSVEAPDADAAIEAAASEFRTGVAADRGAPRVTRRLGKR